MQYSTIILGNGIQLRPEILQTLPLPPSSLAFLVLIAGLSIFLVYQVFNSAQSYGRNSGTTGD